MRSFGGLVLAGALMLGACRSSSPTRATLTSGSTSSTGAPTTSAPAHHGPPTPPLDFATPRAFRQPTFVESNPYGSVAITAITDGTPLQVLAAAWPHSLSSQFARVAQRAPDGGLLVEGFAPPAGGGPAYRYVPFWRDTKTGKEFPGESATVSPDSRRIATLITRPDRQQIVRQYDFSTGRALTDLAAGVENGYGDVLGFDWTPDNARLVVAVSPGGPGRPGGLYVVARDAHQLPARPTVADVGRLAYSNPAVLANGHVVGFEYQFPIQHDAWGGAVVDLDLSTGTPRTVMGSTQIFGNGSPLCNAPPSAPTTTASNPSCYFEIGGSTAAHGGQALVTDGVGGIWLYDGQTVRRIASGAFDARAEW